MKTDINHQDSLYYNDLCVIAQLEHLQLTPNPKKKYFIHLVKMHLATNYFYNNYVIACSLIL